MTTRHQVLVVDDDPLVAESLAAFLAEEGCDTASAHSAAAAREFLAARHPDAPPVAAVFCDLALPGEPGPDLLRWLAKEHPATAVVMLTGYGTVESAVECLRLGAVDYLTKPVADAELRLALSRALRHHTLASENAGLKRRLTTHNDLAHVVGDDPRMRRIFELVRAVAPSRTTVLMSGESGTGKSLVARAIHDLSPRRDKPFVELSCGSIPETLLESELFGHVKGAFTGAHADKVGRFQAADGGTIFLDEINSASPAMQLKLLRVLQERKFEPVGSTQTIEVDARVVLASNQPLDRLVAEGRFRQDLYYRINVVSIDMPPLRDRPGDVLLLARRFLGRFAAELGKQIVAFTPDAESALARYPFPGNVRELQNIIERAAVLAKGQTITPDELPAHVLTPSPAPSPATTTSDRDDDAPWVPMPLEDALREPERRILLRALRANHWNRQRTAEQLAINRTTLYKKLKALGIESDDERRAG